MQVHSIGQPCQCALLVLFEIVLILVQILHIEMVCMSLRISDISLIGSIDLLLSIDLYHNLKHC